MNKIINYLKSISLFIILFLIYLLIISLIYYLEILSYNTVSIINYIVILLLFFVTPMIPPVTEDNINDK